MRLHEIPAETEAIQPGDMADKLAEFMGRHDFFVLSTHDPADADGLGAQMVTACILRGKGKKFRIINASAIPKHFRYMEQQGIIEQWDKEQHGELLEQAGLILLDTADERTMGQMKDAVYLAKEVFVIDHHEPKRHAAFSGIADPSSASTCELTVELAKSLGAVLDPQTAFAAYIGIAYDTGFFAYSKTGPRTFRSALALFGLGVKPNEVYQQLHENASIAVLLLQKRALASLTLHHGNRVAVQVLRLEDYAEAGASQEDTDGFVNFPMKAKEVVVSLMLKESPEGRIRCSLRSKGNINVAKIAQELNGGGHANASGFKSDLDIDQTLAIALAKIGEHLDRP
ncbi:MAG: bifunctional oligoribonuclease/PAP phosphatase NrnA [Treponema sp.]|jgi:phosphoesterase RecJ-like protein|nr:bifunctional oligoribonuclease/PAP phosphatase NrnA [Treponema sp.]